MCRLPFQIVLLVVLLPLLAEGTRGPKTEESPNSSPSTHMTGGPGSMPLAFTKNMGQWPDSILFRASAGGTTMWFTKDGVYYQYMRRIVTNARGAARVADGADQSDMPGKFGHEADSVEIAMIKAEYVGANVSTEVVGLGELGYKCNFFIGGDPAKWRTDVPNYSGIVMKGMYPGVDATFRGVNGKLECELTGNSSDLAKVDIAYRGAQAVERQQDGLSIVTTEFGDQKFFGVLPEPEANSVASTVATLADPQVVGLVYSTYLGGTGYDGGKGVAVDGAGCAYVAGYTSSWGFPTKNAYDASYSTSGNDVFVTKFGAAGDTLIYSTFLGGSSESVGHSIAVDGSGCAYVTGSTRATDFPTQSAFDASYNGGTHDVFVAKLSAAGNALVYSTYLGGAVSDEGYGIALDGSNHAYVTGYTSSTGYPVKNAYCTYVSGGIDAFVTEVSTAGDSLIYSTFLGGTASDYGQAIAVDDSNSAYVTGYTSSSDFPTQNAYDASQNGASDVFVAKFSAAGSSLVYSTFLGGSTSDFGEAILVGDEGQAYVTGASLSSDFPTKDAFDASYNGSYDVFGTVLSANGDSLKYSTFLGGSDSDYGDGIAMDEAGFVYLTGKTYSTNFPTVNAYDNTPNGSFDAFVTKFSATGNTLVFSTYLGGTTDDFGAGMAVDGSGNMYVTGETQSSNFPTHSAFDSTFNGSYDAFVTKLGAVSCCQGTRGNVNLTGVVDLTDLTALVSYLTGAGYELPCPEAANVNGAGIIDLTDLSALVSYLTAAGFVLPSCP